MTIAVNTRLLLPGRLDGIGWFTFETLRRITTQHPEHQFLFLFDRKPDPQYRFSPNVRLVHIGPPARHPVLWWLWFEISLPYILRKYKADMLLSPEGMLSLRAKVPTLEVIHDLNFEHAPDYLRPSHQRFMTHFSPRYARKAQRIATVSEFSKRDIVETYSIPAEKIDVVYDGSHEGYRPLSEEEKASVRQQHTGGAPYFIFIGTISKRKNLSGTMLAFDLFKREHPGPEKLLVVGHRFNWPPEMEQLYHSLACKEDILFFGRAEAEQLAQLLGASLGLVYCSLFEGFGIPIVEAFQAEVPVITSTLTSMPEVSGDAALLVDPTDTQDIADAMHHLASSPALRQELIAKGRARRDLFSWDRSASLLWNSLKKLMCILLALLPLSTLHSQNLVYNPSFEDYLECPRRIDALGVLTTVEAWFQPTKGSADYFNVCGSRDCGIPKNKLGIQEAHSGQGMCGIYCSKQDYREYLQTQLIEPLQAGARYRLTFYVSLSEYSTGAVATIGGLLTRERPEDTVRSILMKKEIRAVNPFVSQTLSTYYEPQVMNPYEQPITDFRRWTRISGEFVAEGGEEYLTIGNFLPADRSHIVDLDSLTYLLPGAYYYIDDVELVCLDCQEIPSSTPPAPQPSTEYTLGETIILENIFFDFDKATLLQQSFKELQRLLTILQEHPTMKIEIGGHTDGKGSEDYNQRLSEARAKAVVDYLIAKGIDPRRLRHKGYGKTRPIAPNDTEEGRARNRRVEFRILAL